MELEERLRHARSAELKAAAEAVREREAAARARAVAAAAQLERGGLRDIIQTLQVTLAGPLCPGPALLWACTAPSRSTQCEAVVTVNERETHCE